MDYEYGDKRDKYTKYFKIKDYLCFIIYYVVKFSHILYYVELGSRYN